MCAIRHAAGPARREAGRLQNLIHRYINEPSPEIFAEILLVREAVLGTLRTRSPSDPVLSSAMADLAGVTERFLGFNDLRAVQATITHTYEDEVLRPAREMAGLDPRRVDLAARRLDPPALGKSREAFTAAVVAANAYYLSLASNAVEEARRNTETIEKTIPGHDRPCRRRYSALRARCTEAAPKRCAPVLPIFPRSSLRAPMFCARRSTAIRPG